MTEQPTFGEPAQRPKSREHGIRQHIGSAVPDGEREVSWVGERRRPGSRRGDDEMGDSAMTRMIELGGVLRLVKDRLNQGDTAIPSGKGRTIISVVGFICLHVIEVSAFASSQYDTLRANSNCYPRSYGKVESKIYSTIYGKIGC